MAVMRTSIHGRRFGLSSTGGLLTGYGSTGGLSTAFDMQAQMWGKEMFETLTSSEATISNTGVTLLAATSATAQTYTLAPPALGAAKEIYITTSGSDVAIDSIALFRSSANVGSTIINLIAAPGLTGGSFLTLRAISTASWQITGKSAGVTT